MYTGHCCACTGVCGHIGPPAFCEMHRQQNLPPYHFGAAQDFNTYNIQTRLEKIERLLEQLLKEKK